MTNQAANPNRILPCEPEQPLNSAGPNVPGEGGMNTDVPGPTCGPRSSGEQLGQGALGNAKRPLGSEIVKGLPGQVSERVP